MALSHNFIEYLRPQALCKRRGRSLIGEKIAHRFRKNKPQISRKLQIQSKLQQMITQKCQLSGINASNEFQSDPEFILGYLCYFCAFCSQKYVSDYW
jgi:hypothetical protein